MGQWTDPTKPWYLYRSHDEDGEPGNVWPSQEPPPRPEQFDPADVVAPEWPCADWCGKKKGHPPHTWGGEGWSPFRCKGNQEDLGQNFSL